MFTTDRQKSYQIDFVTPIKSVLLAHATSTPTIAFLLHDDNDMNVQRPHVITYFLADVSFLLELFSQRMHAQRIAR